MLINCTLPAINYSTCYHGEANVLMRGNGRKHEQVGNARQTHSIYKLTAHLLMFVVIGRF